MKIKVNEATRIQLDWLVATIEGLDVYIPSFAETPWLAIRTDTGIYRCPSFTTDPAQGHPILEKHVTGIYKVGSRRNAFWEVCVGYEDCPDHAVAQGPTILVAGLRAYVASKLGDEVEVPEELA